MFDLQICVSNKIFVHTGEIMKIRIVTADGYCIEYLFVYSVRGNLELFQSINIVIVCIKMGNLFGVRRRAPMVTAQDKAILSLKQQRDKIKIYQKKVDANLEKDKELTIKLYQSGYQERALIIMRRKKCMEDILKRTDQQLNTLEQLVSDIEFTQIEVSVVEGLKVGTEAMKQLNSLMNIDDIQQMMEENAEAAEKQKEISDLLSNSMVRFDEKELLDELEIIAKVENLPDTPIAVIEPKKEEENKLEEEPIKDQEERRDDEEQDKEEIKEKSRQLVPA